MHKNKNLAQITNKQWKQLLTMDKQQPMGPLLMLCIISKISENNSKMAYYLLTQRFSLHWPLSV